jgi:hypothetical protein
VAPDAGFLPLGAGRSIGAPASRFHPSSDKNVKNLTAAMQAVAAVKSPAEFIELQAVDKEEVERCQRQPAHCPIEHPRIH